MDEETKEFYRNMAQAVIDAGQEKDATIREYEQATKKLLGAMCADEYYVLYYGDHKLEAVFPEDRDVFLSIERRSIVDLDL